MNGTRNMGNTDQAVVNLNKQVSQGRYLNSATWLPIGRQYSCGAFCAVRPGGGGSAT